MDCTLLATAMQRSSTGLIMVDESRSIILWNNKMESWSGLTQEVVIGQQLATVFPGHALAPRLLRAVDLATRTGSSSVLSQAFTPHPFPLTQVQDPSRRAVQSVTIQGLLGEDARRSCLLEIQDLSHSDQREKLILKKSHELQHNSEELATAHMQLEDELRNRRMLLHSITSLLVAIDDEDRIVQWNDSAKMILGGSAQERLGTTITQARIPWDTAAVELACQSCRREERTVQLPSLDYTRDDGTVGVLDARIHPLLDGAGKCRGVLLLAEDQTEHMQLRVQLETGRKVAAIGQLAAGIAHEINTPIQFVADNVSFLQHAFEDVLSLLERAALDGERDMSPADRDELLLEVPLAIGQALEGVRRVSKIVGAMKSFSHPGQTQMTRVDLNALIESTVTVSTSAWKYVAEVQLDLDSELPMVDCLPGLLNQVILNLIVNAAHAIEDL
ncbi:MAG: PAS domain S-box-containing protein, partial [Chlamydiales bacterium]